MSRDGRPLVRAAGVLVVFLLAGAGAGLLWEWWWDPPAGLSYQGEWFLEPAGPDVSFEGVALFVLIAFPLGLVLAVLAGIRRGHVHGQSDKTGSAPLSDPVHPGELLATIYHAFGIDPATMVLNHLNQPRELVKAEAVTRLFG